MARYTGPKHRIARREGVNILDKTSVSLERRLNIPPGVHGKKGRKRLSEYGLQLREKQKAKAMYGLLEKQFKRLVKTVQAKKGETGELLISLLETRLDNVVYRLGFARSRPMARQLVSHGHILVNGKKVTIPSYTVKKDDTITLEEGFYQKLIAAQALTEDQLLPFLEKKDNTGRLARIPKGEDITVPFSVQAIVEYYSR